MKCQLYTNNTRTKPYCLQPVFVAKPHLNWNTDAAKLIEYTLKALATVSVAKSLMDSVRVIKQQQTYTNIPEFQMMQFCLDDHKEVSNKTAETLKDNIYSCSENANILEEHAQLFEDALNDENMQLDNIEHIIFSRHVITSLDILGKKNLEAAFEMGNVGFDEFCRAVYVLSNMAHNCELELLKTKINPENTKNYKKLKSGISKDKRKINKLLGKDELKKRKEIKKKINSLNSDKTNSKKIKELKSQIQNLYRESDNAEEINNLTQSINEKQVTLKEFLKQKVNLSPHEIVQKIRVISALINTLYIKSWRIDDNCLDQTLLKKVVKYWDSIEYDAVFGSLFFTDKEVASQFSEDEILDINSAIVQKYDESAHRDIRKMFNLIKTESPEDKKAWNEYITKKILELLKVNVDKEFTKILNLAECKYLDDLALSIGDSDFCDSFRLLVGIFSNMFSSGNSDLQNCIDKINHKTREIFEENDVDYNKWAHFDKDSYIEQNITIEAAAAKQKAVKNLCEELTNSRYMSKIPLNEQNNLFKKLENIDVKVDREFKTVKIHGRDIVFEDLNLIINTILDELNTNAFWLEKSKDENINKAVDLIVNHFEQRYNEILNIPRLKERENVNIKVRKVDMKDVKYALCLGNHSHCCTALGSQINEWTAPNNILSGCISAIEVIADDKPVGNTMIHLAKINGELALVLDNIELQIKYQNNDKIRDMIIEYAKKLCEEIGKPNIPIYANGGAIHKVDMSPYESIHAQISILGKTLKCVDGPMTVYLDYDQSGHAIGYGEIIESDMYKIA